MLPRPTPITETKHMMRTLLLALAIGVFSSSAAAFDHQHQAWTRLLQQHVVVIEAGRSTRVRYHGFAADRPALKDYLDGLAAVTPNQYMGWRCPEFLTGMARTSSTRRAACTALNSILPATQNR